MKPLALRSLAVASSTLLFVVYVAHASMTSGCSKAETATKDPQPPPGNATSNVVPAATTSAPPAVPSASAAPSAAPAPPVKPRAPFGGSKSGIIFRPQDAQ